MSHEYDKWSFFPLFFWTKPIQPWRMYWPMHWWTSKIARNSRTHPSWAEKWSKNTIQLHDTIPIDKSAARAHTRARCRNNWFSNSIDAVVLSDACSVRCWCWRWRDKCKIQNNRIFYLTWHFSFIRFDGAHCSHTAHTAQCSCCYCCSYIFYCCELRVNKKGVKIDSPHVLQVETSHEHTRTQRCPTVGGFRRCYLWFLIASSTGLVSVNEPWIFHVHLPSVLWLWHRHKRMKNITRQSQKAIFFSPNHREIAAQSAMWVIELHKRPLLITMRAHRV